MQCSVSPFLDSLGSSDRVEICNAATAWDTPSGETIILIFGQGLWFGERMPDKSLINPNQCRAFGVSLCDDPSDPHRDLGIYDSDSGLFFPMTMQGSFCTLLTRCPTLDELEHCRHVILSDEHHWDPSADPFGNVSSVGRNLSHNAHISAPCEFDYCMSSCGLSIPELATRSAASVQVAASKSKQRTYNNSRKRKADDLDSKPYVPPTPFDRRLEHDSMLTGERHHSVTVENISRKWHIGLKRAKATLKCTTQEGIRSALHPLTRRYRTDLMQSKYRRLNTEFYTDTVFTKIKSLNQCTCFQLWTDGNGFIYVDPLRSKKDIVNSLNNVVENVGIPRKIISDGASEEVGENSRFHKRVRYLNIATHRTEPYSQWQNRAENSVGKLKARWKRRMVRRRVPSRVWDYGLVYEAEIMSRMASGYDGRTGMERITGDTCDISEWTDFEFYDLIWYWDSPFSDENPKLGRWLGVAHRVGSALCYWILKENGEVLARTTVQHLTKEDSLRPEVQDSIRAYHMKLHDRLNIIETCVDGNAFVTYVLDDIPDDGVADDLFNETMDLDDELADNNNEDTYDSYVNAELLLPDKDGESRLGKVLKRVKGDDGTPIGTPNQNPLLDTSEYLVQLSDGSVQRYTANLIAENLFSQVDSEGRRFKLLQEISDHRSTKKAIPKSRGFVKSHNGRMSPVITTAGWEFLVEWKDGSSGWVPLKDIKVSNPIEVAEYSVAARIDQEPAFNWWVHHALKTRHRLVNKVKSKYWDTTHKFGIRLPKSVDEALQIDRDTGTTMWEDAIKKEMKNVRPAFTASDTPLSEARTGKKLVGYQEIGCHMIFDIKMDGKFTRKARFVAGGHTTDPPSSTTYSSVVSRDSVRIAFLLAALNDLDIWTADIGNAYLNAPCREKIWTLAGSEFGSEKGLVMIVTRALYGLKTSGASWRAMFSQSLRDLGFVPTKSDPDVYIRPATKPCGFEYYEMMLVYVDDILHLSHDTSKVEAQLKAAYRLKDGSSGVPERYLGANIKRYNVDGDILYGMTCEDYCNSAIKNVEHMLHQDGDKDGLSKYGKKAASRPFPVAYRPECDVSPELDKSMTSRYLQLIGILRWAVELGRLDIYTEVSILSQHQCLPREGHLDALYRIFWYMKRNKPSRIFFDPKARDVDERLFNSASKEEWLDFYDYANEPIPPNMPEPRGLGVQVTCFVDADHAANKVTRRSHSGIIIYVQNAPIIWFSKRQNTVETSSFGSEFIALRIATEMIEALRYKLRMFGVPIAGPADVFCDNQTVSKNASVPSSTLNKKHNSICYHRVREAEASGAQRVGWIRGEYNQADIFTKTTLSTDVKSNICHEIFGWRRKDIYEINEEEKK